jgi:hypothetical protein
MLCANCTLTAGPRHKRYTPGSVVQAVIFVKSIRHPDELQGELLKPIVARGWKRITMRGHTVLDDDHQFNAPDSAQSQAFQLARENGIGIAVLGVVQ